MLQLADPYCGTILAQNFEPIVDATLPLICRSEKVIRYFSHETADWMLWVKLAMALAAPAQAVWQHHIARTVQVVKDEQTGAITIVRGRPDEAGHDHLTPAAQPEYKYAA
jgi:hypothetical protein